MRTIVLGLMALFATAPAFSWVTGLNVTITNVMLWQDMEATGAPVYFRTSAGHWCWIPATEKAAYATLMMLYATGKPAEVVCYDTADTIMGGVGGAHRLHRLQGM